MTFFERASSALVAAFNRLYRVPVVQTPFDARIDALRGLARSNAMIIDGIKRARNPTLKNLHIDGDVVIETPRTWEISNVAVINNVDDLLLALKAQNEVIAMLIADSDSEPR
jgi:hypothetical protein